MVRKSAMVIDGSDFAQVNRASAIGYPDLMGERSPIEKFD